MPPIPRLSCSAASVRAHSGIVGGLFHPLTHPSPPVAGDEHDQCDSHRHDRACYRQRSQSFRPGSGFRFGGGCFGWFHFRPASSNIRDVTSGSFVCDGQRKCYESTSFLMKRLRSRAGPWGNSTMRMQLEYLSVALLCASSRGFTQQADSLQQQLQQLKQQYANTTRELEQRIAALERQLTEQSETGGKANARTVSSGGLGRRGGRQGVRWRIDSGR